MNHIRHIRLYKKAVVVEVEVAVAVGKSSWENAVGSRQKAASRGRFNSLKV
jgi:hypothetical protein